MLWIQYQSPDLHLGPKFSYCFSPSPLSPFNSFVLIIHRSGQLENKQLRNQRAVKLPVQKSFQRASPCLFSAPLPPSLQQPAGTLLLCYSWPACSCSYSPRLTQQQLLCVCQLASRSPKSSCPPRSPCFPASPPTDLLLLPHHVSHLPQSAPVSYLPHCPEPTPLLSWFTLLAL